MRPDGESGAFETPPVPPGEYLLTVWHKKLKQKGGAARIQAQPGSVLDLDVVITRAKYAK